MARTKNVRPIHEIADDYAERLIANKRPRALIFEPPKSGKGSQTLYLLQHYLDVALPASITIEQLPHRSK